MVLDIGFRLKLAAVGLYLIIVSRIVLTIEQMFRWGWSDITGFGLLHMTGQPKLATMGDHQWVVYKHQRCSCPLSARELS